MLKLTEHASQNILAFLSRINRADCIVSDFNTSFTNGSNEKKQRRQLCLLLGLIDACPLQVQYFFLLNGFRGFLALNMTAVVNIICTRLQIIYIGKTEINTA